MAAPDRFDRPTPRGAWDRTPRLFAALISILCMIAAGPAHAGASAVLTTHQSYVETVMQQSELPTDDPAAMFAFVLGSLPSRVKVYPTENYYYFSFIHNSIRYAGNIRLDAKDRDEGKVHFAYFEDLTEWRDEPPMSYRVFDRAAGVSVEKVERFLYRISYAGKAVEFELNDLSNVKPPAYAVAPDETYIGPIFDDSALRFFLLYNSRLKLFHYVLDETVREPEQFIAMRQTAKRILIGKRTGFAFYRDHRRDRKILIGVFEGNARVNNAFDGPFDQLPDNFIEGDILQKALIEVEPSLAGRIDRYGGLSDGSGRFLIGPYAYYRSEHDLLPFHTCAIDKKLPADEYYACFVMDSSGSGETLAMQRMAARMAEKPSKRSKPMSHASSRRKR